LKLFLDTSSLLKLYHKEEGSEQLLKLALGAQEIYLSTLAKLEFRSALWRKVRTKEISKEECEAVVQIFVQDKQKYHWVLQDQRIDEMAECLLAKWGENGLRTLDSIQLASAITLQGQPDCIFHTADKTLAKMFKKEKLPGASIA
jgi:predicted nucleic acid-binding protein